MFKNLMIILIVFTKYSKNSYKIHQIINKRSLVEHNTIINNTIHNNIFRYLPISIVIL